MSSPFQLEKEIYRNMIPIVDNTLLIVVFHRFAALSLNLKDIYNSIQLSLNGILEAHYVKQHKSIDYQDKDIRKCKLRRENMQL
jgi:hypothetical protein